MTLQQQLEAAVAKATAAAAKLHAVVNGDVDTEVETEGGRLKSLARLTAETAAALADLATLADESREGLLVDRALFSFALNQDGDLIALTDRVELFHLARFELRADGTVIIIYGEDL